MATKTYLNVYVIGLGSSFPVPFVISDGVGILKKAIKTEKEPDLDHIAADRLELYKPAPAVVDNDDDILQKTAPESIRDANKLVPPSRPLSDFFQPPLPTKEIHVVVKLPVGFGQGACSSHPEMAKWLTWLIRFLHIIFSRPPLRLLPTPFTHSYVSPFHIKRCVTPMLCLSTHHSSCSESSPADSLCCPSL